VPSVSDDPGFKGLCERCIDALDGEGPAVKAS
jgi:hypothetical protein